MRNRARPILLTAAAVVLFVGLLAWVLVIAGRTLTTVGWTVAIGGPLLAVVLTLAAARPGGTSG
jgi:multidrug efflux pump subunit AcrB